MNFWQTETDKNIGPHWLSLYRQKKEKSKSCLEHTGVSKLCQNFHFGVNFGGIPLISTINYIQVGLHCLGNCKKKEKRKKRLKQFPNIALHNHFHSTICHDEKQKPNIISHVWSATINGDGCSTRSVVTSR